MNGAFAHSIGETARYVGMTLLAVLLAVIGTGLITQAAWGYLAIRLGATSAGLIIGSAFLVLALACAVARRPPAPVASPGSGISTGLSMASAFVQGLEAGRKTRR